MESYTGQIMIFPRGVPSGWLPCDGRLLQISQYSALFALIGTKYGGDGMKTFGLPNLNGVVCVGQGQSPGSPNNYSLGETGGAAAVVLTQDNIPVHSHSFNVSTARGTVNVADGSQLAMGQTGSRGQFNNANIYAAPVNTPVTLGGPLTPQVAGGGGAHNNMQPYLALPHYICVAGAYPPRG